MIGIIVNSIGVLIGGFIGLLLGKRIKDDLNENILKVIGVVVLLIGLGGVMKGMLSVNIDEYGATSISTSYELELLIFLVVGTLLGHLMRIDTGINKLGLMVEKKLNKGSFSKGFINASLVFCVGTMAIIGSVEAAISGNNTILYTKAAIDAVTALILASTLGFGVLFSSISVFIYQLIFYLLGLSLASFFENQEFLNVFCMVGYAMVLCIGLNFIIPGEKKIKVANMLPGLLLVIIYYIIKIYCFK